MDGWAGDRWMVRVYCCMIAQRSILVISEAVVVREIRCNILGAAD